MAHHPCFFTRWYMLLNIPAWLGLPHTPPLAGAPAASPVFWSPLVPKLVLATLCATSHGCGRQEMVSIREYSLHVYTLNNTKCNDSGSIARTGMCIGLQHDCNLVRGHPRQDHHARCANRRLQSW